MSIALLAILGGARATAGVILKIDQGSKGVSDIRAADFLRLPDTMPSGEKLTIGLTPPGEAPRRFESGLRVESLINDTVLLGAGWESLGASLSTSNHYLDFLLAKKLLLIRYYLYGDIAKGPSAPSRLSASLGPTAAGPAMTSLVQIVDVSGGGGGRDEDESYATTPTRITDLGQTRVFWFVVPLVPMALALAGLGTVARWLSAALNFWMAMVAALVILIFLYMQGMGAIWYTIAEFLVPTLFSAGLGCCVAGAFAMQS